MDERVPALRRALVDAIAAAHRLRQESASEEREADRWVQRATYAERRGLEDLASAARARAERHSGMARLLDRRAAEMRAEVQRLRSELEATTGGGRPPPAPELEAKFAALEVERELEQLRAARFVEAPPAQIQRPDLE